MLHPSQFLLQRNISYIFCTIITPPPPPHPESRRVSPTSRLVPVVELQLDINKAGISPLHSYLIESSSRSSLGVLPYTSRKHLVKYAGFENPAA